MTGVQTCALPICLRNRKLKIEFFMTTPASSAGTWSISLYDSGNSRVTLTTDSPSSTTLPSGVTGKFTAYFDATASATYSLRLTQTARTSANTLYITNVIVGPGIQPQGAVVGEWQTFTPTFSSVFGAVTNIKMFYRRIGDSMQVAGRWQCGTIGSGTLTITLPSNLNSDSSKNGAANTYIGRWVGNNANTNQTKAGTIIQPSSNSNFIYFGVDDYVQAADGLTAISGYLLNNMVLSVNFTVPVAEWASSGTVNLAQNDVEYASNSTSFGSNNITAFQYGPAGQPIAGLADPGQTSNQRVRFLSPIQPGDQLIVELSTDRVVWTPSSASRINGVPLIQGVDTSGNNLCGIWMERVSSSATDVDVFFGRYMSIANDDAPAVNWPTTNAYWRVRKTSAGAAVGFGIVNGQSAGLLPSTNGGLDDATATRLGLKQYIYASDNSNTPTTPTYKDGIMPTVFFGGPVGTITRTHRAIFVPKQMQDGTWRLQFTIVVLVSGDTRTSATFGIIGITSKNITSYNQPILAWQGNSTSISTTTAYMDINTNTMTIWHTSTVTSLYRIAGDIELETKPTWAYNI